MLVQDVESIDIQAAVCRQTGEAFSLESLRLNGPRENELLVRMVATGICHTDLGMRDSPDRVPKPIVLGHEGAGVVEQVGSAVRKVRPGDHVVISFNTCGECVSCRRGDVAYCSALNQSNFSGGRPDGSTALHDGQCPVHSHFFGQSSFATHAICYERNAVVVRKDVPLELLGPLGCGIQTGAGAVLNSLKVPAGSSIGIFGTGSVGLAAVMAAKVSDAKTIVAVDTNSARLSLARQLGATHTLNPAGQDVFETIREITEGGMNFAIDTSGNHDVIRNAAFNLAPRGVCGLINTAKGRDVGVNVLQMVLGGLSVRGIHQGDSCPAKFIPEMIEMYLQGRFPFDKLVQFYHLTEINQAIADMESGTTVKPVIRMTQPSAEQNRLAAD